MALDTIDKTDSRGEDRTKGSEKASVEFIPVGREIAYHFKLKDFSSKGFGIIVREDSKVLEHIKEGDILTMKYHPDSAIANPIPHRTQIRHITKPEPGKHKDHLLVGLQILD